MRIYLSFLLALFLSAPGAVAENWQQGSGLSGDYHAATGKAPTSWSVVHGKNIRWSRPLPETGQSTVTIHGNRLFYTCYVPVTENSSLGSDIVAYCANADTGEVLWKRTIKAKYPLRLSGCFSDSTSPPAVTDGKRVCFFNASGTIACFDMDGKQLWQKESMAVGRSQPFLINGSVVYTKQSYMPDKGHFSHAHKNAPLEQWTQLQAIELATGNLTWTSTCGANMGSIPMAQKMPDGKDVILVGRGGGHGPPEKPLGVSMIDGLTGKTKWTLPLDSFMSTQTNPVWHGDALVFHGDEHLWVDATDGKIRKRVNFCKEVSVRKWDREGYTDATETLKFKKGRAITQQSNLRVGDYHYFRAYQHNYLGRIHLKTGSVEYLQLPVQLIREPGKSDQLAWELKDKRFRAASMTNRNGFMVMGDKRSKTNTWGHHASPIMTAVGDCLYLPTLVGTVYCIKWNAPKLDEHAIVAINDLGPAGETWTRASLSYSSGRLYARTIKDLICIGDRQSNSE